MASLPASDYGYMLCVPSQRTEDFVYAIAQFLKHIGGVPKILVPDNLKAAIVKTDRYEPTINKMLEDMAITTDASYNQPDLCIPRTRALWRTM